MMEEVSSSMVYLIYYEKTFVNVTMYPHPAQQYKKGGKRTILPSQ
jgi:hypothetical protein